MKTKICKKCGIEKQLSEFHKDKTAKDGYRSACKKCRQKDTKKRYESKKDEILAKNEKYYKKNRDKINKHKRENYYPEYYNKNKEDILQKNREYHKNNQEYFKEYSKRYRIENAEKEAKRLHEHYIKNKERYTMNTNKRRAMLKSLPNTLTNEDWNNILKDFNNCCALSNSSERISMEHFIPVSSGFGGTTKGNVYPMNLSLNISKSDKNPFEWIKTQPEEYQDNFYNVLVPYLAGQNNMSLEEFTKYVYSCFEE